MKKKTFMLNLIGLLLLTSGLLAQPEGPPPRPKLPGRHIPDLTDEQRAQLLDMRLELQRQMLPLKSKLPALRGELKMEITAEKFNEGNVEKIVEQIQKVQAQMRMKEILHHRAVREILTPEQRKKFDLQLLLKMGAGKPGLPGPLPRAPKAPPPPKVRRR